jgi:hypothetical protein
MYIVRQETFQEITEDHQRQNVFPQLTSPAVFCENEHHGGE